jgi:hypothetical protein
MTIALYTVVIIMSVLKPWTPIEQIPHGIKVWNREYKWNNRPLPSMKSGGINCFHKPPEIIFNGDYVRGNTYSFQTHGEKAILFGWSNDGKVRWIMDCEYDGLIEVFFHVSPYIQCNSLELSFNINPEIVDAIYQRNHYDRYQERPYRPWGHVISRDPYHIEWYLGDKFNRGKNTPPYLWIYNNDCGFSICFENDYNWRNPNLDRPMVFKEENGEYTLKITLVSEPFQIDKGVDYRFWICASPVRPIDKSLRAWKDTSTVGTTEINGEIVAVESNQVYGWGDTYWNEGTTLPSNEPDEKWLKHREWYPGGALVYSSIGNVGAPVANEHPEWVAYKEGEPWHGSHGDMRVNPVYGLQKFHLDHWKRIFENYSTPDVLGAYVDVANGQWSDIDEIDVFERPITYQWSYRGLRQFFKKLYALCLEHGRQLEIHAHSNHIPGIQTFAHSSYPGEDIHNYLKQDLQTYWNGKLPWTYYRTQFGSGLSPRFLPQWGRAPGSTKNNPEETRAMIGAVSIHGFTSIAGGHTHKDTSEAWQLMVYDWFKDDFKSPVFHGYWEQTEYENTDIDSAPDTDGVYISYWERADYERLITIFNNTEEIIIEEIHGEEYTIQPHDYALIKVEISSTQVN